MRSIRSIAVAMLVGASVLGGASSASAGLIDAAPSSVTVEAPAPGHEAAWSLTVRNRTAETLPLSLVVEGADGPLTTGPTPVTISLSGPAGPVLSDVPSGELIGTTTALEPLAPGEVRTLDGVAALPAEAGDAYQGADGRLVLRLTAQDGAASDRNDAQPAQGLSRTGAEIALGATAASLLILGGLVAVILDRRRRSHRA